MAEFDLLCCVVNMGDASKVLKFARKYGIKEGTISIGKGTAHSRILEFLRINEIRKEIVTMIADRKLASAALRGINEDMAFEKPHHGIAFSYPITQLEPDGNPGDTDKIISEERAPMDSYSAIYVIVDKGKAEEVIAAANHAGARGGTIVNARGSGIHEAQKFFSIEIEPEKEKVFIIARDEKKDDIIASVRTALKIDEPGNGVIYVLPINEVYGLH